ncbi:ADP-ribosylation factor-like protein 2-binding protein [Saccoglossus kowalevskii]|uniref:ADP-ribosylation factor-like protein 2-binding protein n=1 Tax=Saccoglossus kowalevskii TaxID=10224 RepID=A0ABM0GV22_SACKO|nr:PREDICTED: ADP-ribosylation factor-like protein 2-binding protein-like isoform 2 [Saccoglossus kowalevskii]
MAASNIGNDDIEDMEFQEENLCSSSSSISDTKFDMTIGHIEDIIMDDDFQDMQQNFMEKNYVHFEDTEENKFIYTDIFKEYTDLIEKFIEDKLTARMPGFVMSEFTRQLQTRQNELSGEIFEILLTFSDFISFKEMFIDYKAEKEGRTVDFSSGFVITPCSQQLEISSQNLEPPTS